MSGIGNWLLERFEKSLENAKKVHSYWLSKSEGRILLLIAVFLWVIFSYALIQDSLKIGISFVITGLMVIYSGAIYRDERVMGIVVVGVFVATLVPQFIADAWGAFKYGDWVSTVILLAFTIFLWYWSSVMKRGRLLEIGGSKRVKKSRRVVRRKR